jgi:molecular chaperone IbpA
MDQCWKMDRGGLAKIAVGRAARAPVGTGDGGPLSDDAIRGEKQTNDEEKAGEVLYQGIAARTFERSFQLADYVEVKGASLENGLLHVDLVREIPEAMKPRAIPIASSSKLLEVKPTKVAA